MSFETWAPSTVAEPLASALLDAVPDALLVVDPTAHIVQANRRAQELLGRERAELVGAPASLVLPPGVPAEIVRVAEAGAGEDSAREALGARFVRDRDGAEHCVSLTLGSVEAQRGRLVVVVLHELEPGTSDRELREAEEHFRVAFTEAPIGVAIVAVDGRFVRVNGVLCELLGYSPAELTRLTFQDVTHPADRDVGPAVLGPLLRGDLSRCQLSKRYLRKDGGVVDVMLSISVVRDRAGQPLHFITHVEDVSAQRRGELERAEATQRLQAVLEQAPVGILIVEGRRRERVSANARAIELMGTAFVASCAGGVSEASTFVYTPAGERVPFSELPSTRALHGEHTVGRELALRGEGGKLVPLLVSAAPLGGEAGIEGAVVVFEDQTAAKELERLRAEWSSIIAHDLRAPLQSVLLSVQALERSCDDKEKLRRRVQRITQTLGRLSRAISDLVDSSRLEAGRLELDRKPLDLVDLVRASADRLALQVGDRRVEVHIDGPLPPLAGDADRIAQVMDNLLSNAVKYGYPGTPIVVHVEPRGGTVVVSVTNHGPGILAETLPRLFGRFFRTTSAKTSGIEGLGLGLYITRELVTAHGGVIVAESEPGKQTTFRFTLPAASH